jgi:hypothetical protein
MRRILIAMSFMLFAQPALSAAKCNKIIGKSVHVSGKVFSAIIANDGYQSYMVLTAQTGGFPYCNSAMTVVSGGKGPLRCKEGQQMEADGVVSGTVVGMGDAQVESTRLSCQ